MKQLILSLALLLAMPAFSEPPSDTDVIFSQPDVRRYNLGLGRAVFQEKCIRCHGGGDENVPQLGDLQDWRNRIGKPLDLLIKHAILGHGEMPPKGDNEELTNREVSAAVAYIVDQGRRVLARQGGLDVPPEDPCPAGGTDDDCHTIRVQEAMLMEMLWRLTGNNMVQ
jgi:cytochrome c5